MRRILVVCPKEGAHCWTVAQLLGKSIGDCYVCSRCRIIVNIVCVVILNGRFVGKCDIIELARVLEVDREYVSDGLLILL